MIIKLFGKGSHDVVVVNLAVISSAGKSEARITYCAVASSMAKTESARLETCRFNCPVSEQRDYRRRARGASQRLELSSIFNQTRIEYLGDCTGLGFPLRTR